MEFDQEEVFGALCPSLTLPWDTGSVTVVNRWETKEAKGTTSELTGDEDLKKTKKGVLSFMLEVERKHEEAYSKIYDILKQTIPDKDIGGSDDPLEITENQAFEIKNVINKFLKDYFNFILENTWLVKRKVELSIYGQDSTSLFEEFFFEMIASFGLYSDKLNWLEGYDQKNLEKRVEEKLPGWREKHFSYQDHP